MELTSPIVSSSFSARAEPTGTGVSGPQTIGLKEFSRRYDASVVGAATITAAANSNVATLTASTCAIAQTTGSPVILDGDGKDFEGVTFPTVAKFQAVRIIAGGANVGTVAVGGSSSGRFPAITLDGGAAITLQLPAAGLTISAQTITFTFSNSGDSVTVEFLAADE